MIVIAGTNGRVGMKPAMDVLRAGGSALDAVEAGIREVELVAEDHSVGLGGFPNLLGQVEVDAGIMDGRTRAVGAVAAIHDWAHPISIARQVMLRLPHVLLAGAGAERFAREIGATPSRLLTPEVAQIWRDRVRDYAGADPDTIQDDPDLASRVLAAMDDRRRGGTIDFLAQDAAGDLAVGVSTSGFAWKYPGRVGDSPIAGAGYYADNRYGAVGCTGVGELAIRCGTARSMVLFLQMGYSLEAAGREVMCDLACMTHAPFVGMNVLAIDPQGHDIGFSNSGDPVYLAITPEMDEPEERRRIQVAGGSEDQTNAREKGFTA
ncbi:MAG: isoaspartyl peptidase/L-asparaginase [Anaerolineae bacterium]